MSELEDITRHITDKISSLQRMLELSVDVLPQSRIKKLGQEVFALDGLLLEFEKCVGLQNDQLKRLKVQSYLAPILDVLSCGEKRHVKLHSKIWQCNAALLIAKHAYLLKCEELDRAFQNDLEEVQHLKDNMPAHMPRKKLPTVGSEPALSQNGAVEPQPVQQENVKKTKSQIREMEFITTPEFESIPQYMKGRTTYGQLNAAVQSINTAVTGKYKILHQSAKTMNNNTRKLYQRFKDEETKDTKGQHFVVEADIREFTQMKVDKRFQGILNMLRHCQRLRELRGGGLTRYLLL